SVSSPISITSQQFDRSMLLSLGMENRILSAGYLSPGVMVSPTGMARAWLMIVQLPEGVAVASDTFIKASCLRPLYGQLSRRVMEAFEIVISIESDLTRYSPSKVPARAN